MSELSDKISDYIFKEASNFARSSHSNPCFPYTTYIHCLLLYSVKKKLTSHGMYNIVQNSFRNTIQSVVRLVGGPDDTSYIIDLFYKSLDLIESEGSVLNSSMSFPENIVLTKQLYIASGLDNPNHSLRFPIEEEVIFLSSAIENVSSFIDSLSFEKLSTSPVSTSASSKTMPPVNISRYEGAGFYSSSKKTHRKEMDIFLLSFILFIVLTVFVCLLISM